MRGCGQDTEIEVFLGRKVFVKQRFDYSPLVETEIVDEYEKYFLPVVDEGEDFGFEKFMAHQGMLASGNPLFVVFLDEFGESAVGFGLLHGEQFVHIAFGLCEFQFPEHELFVNFKPVVPRIGVVYLAANVLELLSIVARCLFQDDLFVVEIFLYGEENLIGIDRLDEVIGYFVSDGLVHDVFFFALGDHDDGNLGIFHLDLAEGIEPAQSRHVFVEDNEVEGLMSSFFKRISSIRYSCDFISFLL